MRSHLLCVFDGVDIFNTVVVLICGIRSLQDQTVDWNVKKHKNTLSNVNKSKLSRIDKKILISSLQVTIDCAA